MKLATITYSTALVIMLGWLLWIGKPVLLPVISAIIVLYVLSAAANWLGNVPVLRSAPSWLLRILVLVGFTAAIALLFFLFVTSFLRVASALPGYESNLNALVARAVIFLGIGEEPNWAILRESTLGRIDATRLIAPLVNSVGTFSVALFLIVLYAAFFFAERMYFASKLAIALGGTERGDHAMALLDRINERVGKYLVVKTTVNLILGVLSLAIMWAIGIEFAVFWAVLIAFLNYVPYFGSLVGVMFPVLLSLAQSGSIAFATLCLVTLSAAQIFVAGVLEPRLMGRAFNLSPVVVLLALAFWGTLWGVPGAMLAVPLTASLVIVFAEVDGTRPVAVMLSARGIV
jgi:predicted PurR-regulated permease PerM